jgi:hypothetical protein
VQAFVFADGHDSIACEVHHGWPTPRRCALFSMTARGNECGEADFPLTAIRRYSYRVRAWINRSRGGVDLKKRIAAAQELAVGFAHQRRLPIEQAARRANGDDAARLMRGEFLRGEDRSMAESNELLSTAREYLDLNLAVWHERELSVIVERGRARFSTWYEIFPRSTSPHTDWRGTFSDCRWRLLYHGRLLEEGSRHTKLQRWVRDLNTLLRGEGALYELNSDWAGFERIDCNGVARSVLTFVRKGIRRKIRYCSFAASLRRLVTTTVWTRRMAASGKDHEQRRALLWRPRAGKYGRRGGESVADA